MKKTIIIIIIILVAAGVFWLYKNNFAKKPVAEKVPDEQFSGLRVVENNTLLGWLKRKGGVECELTSSQGEKIILKTLDDKARTQGIDYAFGKNTEKGKGTAITNSGWVYMWSGKNGTKMNLEAMQTSMDEEQKAKAKDYSWEDQAKGWEDSGFTFTCEYKKFSDSDFTPPENVEFSDMTNTLINAQKAASELKKTAPGGNINQEDIEAQMENLNNEGQ